MADKRPTSYDVARLAGVSQATVSRVLFSSKGSASQTTRERVEKAARQLGFAPNPIARSLNLGRSQLAGLIVTQYTQESYPVALKSAVDMMTESGDSLLVQIVGSSEIGNMTVRRLLNKHVDVIISAASLSTESARSCKQAGVPLVIINRELDFGGIDFIASPNAGIMHDVVKLLVSNGARRPLFLGGDDANWISGERCKGFKEACAKFGLPAPFVLESTFDYAGGRNAVRNLGPKCREFDAIVAATDAMALGAVDACRFDLGLAVPADIQVVGHDDIEAASYGAYQLTSVRQNMRMMLQMAIEIAYSRLENPDREDVDIVVPNELVIRRTTRGVVE